jgi:hypothetical protein
MKTADFWEFSPLMKDQGGEKPGDEAEDECLQQCHGALSLHPRGKANKLVVRG